MTPPTTKFSLVNSTGSSNAFAYINGLDLNDNNRPIFIQSDGQTVYKPESPSAEQAELAADCAIPLNSPGSAVDVTIPRIAGGRIWFVIDGKLSFKLNPGPAVVEPAVTNPDDVNYNLNWGFAEFTFNEQQLFVNISYVDFVALPIALNLRNTDGKEQIVQGIPNGGVNQVADALAKQQSADNAGWDKLIIKAPDGTVLRALSPNAGRVLDTSLFNDYYQSYVDDVWAKYTNEDLTVNTQWDWGTVTGRVKNNVLDFGDSMTFAKPSAGDIFSCSTGPFANYPEDKVEVMGAIGARLAAAFNRSTLLSNSKQPDGEVVADYYTTNPTNHYARICHQVNSDNRGYAFPYDDVVASNDTQPDQAGTAFDGSPEVLTITLGSLAATSEGDKKSGTGGIMDRMMGSVKKAWKGMKGMATSCFSGSG